MLTPTASACCLGASHLRALEHAHDAVTPRLTASAEQLRGTWCFAGPRASCCVVGSNDPHGLQLNDDRAPLPRRRPSFHVGRHLEEDDVRVRRRPLPRLNTATPSAAKPPPPPPPPNPPLVTRVEQVVPKRSLALVRTWLRRLRRCLRAAAAGKASLAKRLRPADLWLPLAEHSVQATRPWRWDLTPLARGEPAVPSPVSGRDGVTPLTGLVLGEFALEANVGFTDEGILSEVGNGIEDDSDCAEGTLLCAPHGSALEQFATADAKLAASLKAGWSSESPDLPCWPLRTYPVGIVDESERAGRPKFRLTSDLSWPHSGALPDGHGWFVDSVNSAMRRQDWPANRLPRASEIAEAAAILQSSGEEVKAWGFDCKAYYRCHGRQRSQLWRNAVAWAGGFQIDERCCFGSAADAVKCSRVSNFIAWRIRRALAAVDARYPTRSARVLEWQAERRAAAAAAGVTSADELESYTALFSVGIYIDDAAGSSVNDVIIGDDGEPLWRDGVQLRRARLHWDAALAELTSLGYESETTKEQPPADRLEVLGVAVDLVTKRLTLLSRKRESYARRASDMAARRFCSKAELLSLLGRLSFAACCYPAGRSWLDAAWRSVRAKYRLRAGDEQVALSPAARAGFERWASELLDANHTGVPLAARSMRQFGDSSVGAIYADASDNGFAAWTVSEGELFYLDGLFSVDTSESIPIHGKELIASTLGLVALAPACGLRDVYSFSDNVVAQYAMRSGTSNSPPMQSLVARRSEWLLESGTLEASERITSKANLWADLGSRGRTDEMLRQAAALDLPARRVAVPTDWSLAALEFDWLASSDSQLPTAGGGQQSASADTTRTAG